MQILKNFEFRIKILFSGLRAAPRCPLSPAPATAPLAAVDCRAAHDLQSARLLHGLFT